jgi:hypothetical protein
LRCSSFARRSRLFLTLGGLLVLTGCQVRATVTVDADATGSGTVAVRVALDREAASRVPGLRLRTDDLVEAGWEVTGPTDAPGGGLVIVARHAFDSPADAERLIEQVSGEDGVLRGFDLERDWTFLQTRTRLAGTIDLTAGVAGFSDSALAERLGGQSLGVDPSQLAALDDALRMEVVAELPGGSSLFSARAGQRVPVRAEAEAWNVVSLAFAALALLCAVACVLTVRRVRRR